jgi:hypothetical protein
MSKASPELIETVEALLARLNLMAVIDHSGRGGNAFFLTLFDLHPDVACCPWIHYTYSGIVTEFGDRTEIDAEQAGRFASEKGYFRLVYQPEDPGDLVRRIGGDPDAAVIDRDLTRAVFDAVISKRSTITRRELALLPLAAVAAGRGMDLSRIRYALVSDAISLRFERVADGFSGRVIDAMIADHPQARLFSIVRDPRATFASPRHQFVNSLGNMYALRPGNAVQRMREILSDDLTPETGAVQMYWLKYICQTARTIYRQKKRYPDHFYTVRNEDLNLDFLPTIEKLARWLDIPVIDQWREENYVPTMMGVRWRGTGAYNSGYQRYIHGPLANDPEEVSQNAAGPNAHVTQRWRSRLNRREIELVERLCREEMLDQGYEILFDSPDRTDDECFNRTAIGPFEGELPTLSWLGKGWEIGAAEFLNRLYYALAFPPFYLAARLLLRRNMRNGMFKNITGAAAPLKSGE